MPPWRVSTQELEAPSKTEAIQIFKAQHSGRYQEYAEESIISINLKNQDYETI